MKILFLLTILITPLLAQEKSSDNALVKRLLSEDLGVRNFSFPQIVLSATGHKVIPFDTSNPVHRLISSAIANAATKTLPLMNAVDSPVRKLARINEASRLFENQLIQRLDAHPDLSCSIPKNTQGKSQRSGYPDMMIVHLKTNTIFYLDPKLFAAKSRSSSLRTFYFEPKTRTMKIHHDAVHLLLGISHDAKPHAWKFLSWELVDLSHLRVRLKAEFQASNKNIYRKAAIIRSKNE